MRSPHRKAKEIESEETKTDDTKMDETNTNKSGRKMYYKCTSQKITFGLLILSNFWPIRYLRKPLYKNRTVRSQPHIESGLYQNTVPVASFGAFLFTACEINMLSTPLVR